MLGGGYGNNRKRIWNGCFVLGNVYNGREDYRHGDELDIRSEKV